MPEFELTGLDGMMVNIEAAMDGMKRQLVQNFETEMEAIKHDAQAITPYDPNNPHDPSLEHHSKRARVESHRAGEEADPGHLRDTALVDIEVDEDGATAIISFNTVYAARQHEEMDYNHREGEQAKFLEQPVNEHSAGLEDRLTQGLDL